MAALEEFLQEKYIENYEKIEEVDSSSKIAQFSQLYSDYFYKPYSDDNIGTADYVSIDGYAFYLINKNGLPNEIKDQLSGGNCGEGLTGMDRYLAYLSLNDVYGVTSDLKVYYSNGDGSLLGVEPKAEQDKDTPARPVLSESNPLANIIKGDGTSVTVADVQAVKSLTINQTSGVTELKDLYVLSSLESLVLENVNLNSLDGIQTALKLNYVYLKNCKIDDGNDTTFLEYAQLAKVAKLTYLYFYSIDDNELEKICEGIKNATYSNLKYVAIVGNESFINNVENSTCSGRTASKYITNLKPLSLLNASCVGNVQYLNLQCNDIGNTTYIENEESKTKYALENIESFSMLFYLRIERNKLTSLKGLGDKSNLHYLYAAYNQLGLEENYTPLTTVIDETTGLERTATDEDKGKNAQNALYDLQFTNMLYYVNFVGNTNLKWVSYLSVDTGLRNLYFGYETVNMVDTEVSKIREILFECGLTKSYPGKYWLSLLDSTTSSLEVDLSDLTITQSQFESLSSYANLTIMNLKNLKIKKSETDSSLVSSEADINLLINNTLQELTSLQKLNVSGIKNLSDISFVKKMNLIEFDAMDTNVTTNKKNEDGEFIGLELLNTNCSSLAVIMINHSDVNLQLIEAAIVKVFRTDDSSAFYIGRCNFYTDNTDVFESFSGLTKLTRIHWQSIKFNDADLNLGNNLGLTVFAQSYGSSFKSVIFPSSIETLRLSYFFGDVNLSQATKLKSLSLYADQRTDFSKIKTMFKSIPDTVVLESLGCSTYVCTQGQNYFKTFDELDEDGTKIRTISFSPAYDSSEQIKTLKGIGVFSNIKTLVLPEGFCSQLNDISELKFISSTLKKVVLRNACIVDASVISKIENLNYLDLENNCLFPYVEIEEISVENGVETSSKTRWNTLKEICEKIIPNATIDSNGKVTTGVTLKLKGNTSITDWSNYTDNIKYFTSDSTYGS